MRRRRIAADSRLGTIRASAEPQCNQGNAGSGMENRPESDSEDSRRFYLAFAGGADMIPWNSSEEYLPMDCPKCGSAMQPVVFQEVEVDRCGACHGIWFDALELDKLTELAGAELIDPPTAAGDGGAKSPRATEMGAKRLCPH